MQDKNLHSGLNIFQIEVSDQLSSQIFDLEVFVDTTKKEFQYNDMFKISYPA